MENKKLVQIEVLALVIVVIGMGFYFISREHKTTEIAVPVVTETNSKDGATEAVKETTSNEFKIVGTDVIQTINGQNSVLFNNVEGVSEVRRGPDGRTLHFRPSGKIDDNQTYCANLEKKDEGYAPPEGSGINVAPIKAPWNFKKINYAYTINGCEYTQGYSPSSNFFVFLKVLPNGEGYLSYENLTFNQVGSVKLDPKLLNESNIIQFNQRWNDGFILGKDGNKYHYPEQIFDAGDKTLIRFGRMVIAVNTQSNKIVGVESLVYKNTMGQDSQNFPTLIPHPQTAVYLVKGNWWETDGYAYTSVLDLNVDSLRKVEMPKKKNGQIYYYDLLVDFSKDVEVDVITWSADGFEIMLIDDQEVEIPKDFRDKNNLYELEGTLTKEEFMAMTRGLELAMLKGSPYKKITCNLYSGMNSPTCRGLNEIVKYKYSTTKGFTKM